MLSRLRARLTACSRDELRALADVMIGHWPEVEVASLIDDRLADHPDAVDAVDGVLLGIEEGRRRYGQLDLATDARDFGYELDQELRDAALYAAAGRLARLDRIARAQATSVELTVPQHVASAVTAPYEYPSCPTVTSGEIECSCMICRGSR